MSNLLKNPKSIPVPTKPKASTPSGFSGRWIGVDLDGTLAYYDKHKHTFDIIGPPVAAMVSRVRDWLARGKDVRIFTARIARTRAEGLVQVQMAIEDWCLAHLGAKLPITNVKDFGCEELWGDECRQVEKNTGIPAVNITAQLIQSLAEDTAYEYSDTWPYVKRKNGRPIADWDVAGDSPLSK